MHDISRAASPVIPGFSPLARFSPFPSPNTPPDDLVITTRAHTHDGSLVLSSAERTHLIHPIISYPTRGHAYVHVHDDVLLEGLQRRRSQLVFRPSVAAQPVLPPPAGPRLAVGREEDRVAPSRAYFGYLSGGQGGGERGRGQPAHMRLEECWRKGLRRRGRDRGEENGNRETERGRASERKPAACMGIHKRFHKRRVPWHLARAPVSHA